MPEPRVALSRNYGGQRPPGERFTFLALDPGSSAPLYQQLYDALRGAILGGQLRPGERLPATRTLAAMLGISRNTALTAFDQLLAEGYVEGRLGAGTFVAH